MPDSDPDSAWRSLHETHLANLRSHRALLDHLAGLHRGDSGADGDNKAELDAMRTRAERIWEDAVRAGEIMMEGRKAKTSRRRISSGLEMSAPGSPAGGEEEDEEEERGEEAEGGEVGGDEEEVAASEEFGEDGGNANMDVDGGADRHIVIANIPRRATASDIWQFLSGYNPIRLKHPIRPPNNPEIRIYALPPQVPQVNGFVKVVLRSAGAAARAVRDLDGVRLNKSNLNKRSSGGHGGGLIVRHYRAAVPMDDDGDGDDDDDDTARAKSKKRLRRGSSEEHLPQPIKRVRVEDGVDVKCTGPAAAAAAAAARRAFRHDPAAAAAAAYLFSFSPAVPQPQQQQQPPPPASTEAVEQEPEFEDISAVVNARLAEQAAKRAAARQKMSTAAAVAGGKKRRRDEGQMEDEAGVGEDEATIAGMAGMALVDRRPRKRMREERKGGGDVEGMAEDAEDGAAKVDRDEASKRVSDIEGEGEAR
ncbi:hypothetical protein SLS58_007486 [Diplodia intermedia]|uniref:RRM domain-containing protein n=1 Tax=Diplodia intermedia TaxID=856260 RepID=A0ABR3TK13_9PEZI